MVRSETKQHLVAVYGGSSLSMTIVKNWFNEFQIGLMSVFDKSCPSSSRTATIEDNVTKIHNLVLADRRNQCLTLFKRNPKESIKHGSTGVHQRPRNSRNNTPHQENVIQSRRRLCYRSKKWCHRFLGFTTSATMPNYWDKLQESSSILRRKNTLPPCHDIGSYLRRCHGQIGPIQWRR